MYRMDPASSALAFSGRMIENKLSTLALANAGPVPDRIFV